MTQRDGDEFPAEFHRNRREHGGASPYLNDDQDNQLAELVEEERVAAGLDDYDPDEVPPATDTPPVPEPVRPVDEGEPWVPTADDPFPPTRYDEDQ
jgi:hypothetical protein